ncbi:MAG TPA: PAS domain-containing protein, partial [Methylomirabilota bacterium]|nr:PAS domain-containing protein [Methylomirabilota bacterium]
SRRAEQILGYPRARWLSEPGFREALVHPDDRERVVALGRECADLGVGHDAEYRAVAADGRVVWLRDVVRVMCGADGVVERVGGVMVDVTRQKAAEQELRESEERLRLAVEAGRLGTWEWKVGAPEATWSFEADIHPEDRARVRASVLEAVEGGEHRVECRIVRPDGAVRWVQGRGRLFHDAEGRADRLLGVWLDVTDQKEAEDERQSLLARAEAARSEAEAANRAKDDFLAMLSHELRTPLTAMLGWVRMLAGGNLGAEQRAKAVEIIDRNTRLQAQLIEDLLDVSRIASGKLQLELEPVDLVGVLDHALDGVRTAADAKGVALVRTLDAGTGPVAGDGTRLQQVVSNLLANAVKFTPAGGRVELALARAGADAVVTVRDDGKGIAAEDLPHVFDRFRQAEGGTHRRHGGLGLGLAIAHQLVQLHGGTIRAA